MNIPTEEDTALLYVALRKVMAAGNGSLPTFLHATEQAEKTIIEFDKKYFDWFQKIKTENAVVKTSTEYPS